MRWFIARWPRFSQSANVEKPLESVSVVEESPLAPWKWKLKTFLPFTKQVTKLHFLRPFQRLFSGRKKSGKMAPKKPTVMVNCHTIRDKWSKQWMIFWIIWYFFGSSLKCQIAKLYCFSNYFQSFFGLYPISERISILGSVLNWLSSWCSRKRKINFRQTQTAFFQRETPLPTWNAFWYSFAVAKKCFTKTSKNRLGLRIPNVS